jgi:hypothetical protein
MKVRLLPTLIAVTFVYSCGSIPQEQKVDVSYENASLKILSSLKCDNDIPCASYEVSYPKFSGLDSSVINKIDREIDASVSMGNPEAEGKTKKEIGEEFIKDYEEFSKTSGEKVEPWYYKSNVVVEVLTDTLISLAINEEYYTGGAHGGTGRYFTNINPLTGKKVSLSDVLKPGYEAALNMLGEKAFRKVKNLSDTSSLVANNFEFPDNTFKLNQNYGFTKEGIEFHFNSYEIAPYAAGPTGIIIGYEELKDWLH